MKKFSGGIWVLVAIVCILSATAVRTMAATPMPSFSLVRVGDGRLVHSESYEGKVLLINFFATWCPACSKEIPGLNSLQKKYEKDDFSVVGLSVDRKGQDIVEKFMKRKGVVYPVLMVDRKTVAAFGGVYGIPVSFLVNKSGYVVKKYNGYVSEKSLEKDVKRLLGS
ncbi:MAG: cytochrome c biogenesis protein (TlpA) [Deltaproteobacteria bacterium]|nr:MAG: cytochrome c biogenesis protein (TlpA) [Desulfobacterales bacterium]PIE73763.1 MAG: cytochrome c biogenesis protein (TlpA) [Deltaproteobacteria bacterium]